MPVYQLSENNLQFPDGRQALLDPDGLLAIGGDLSQARLLAAYYQGIFPWFNEGDPLLWWCPSTRAVFEPQSLLPNRSLRKFVRRHEFRFSVNLAFAEVIRQCAAPRATQQGTWIQHEIIAAYIALHRAGHAHSVEVWQGEQLVAGLYGIQVGALFCGESMFNTVPNGAKIALTQLQYLLTQYTDGWIDCQMPNPFLLQMHATPIPRSDYFQLLSHLRDHAMPTSMWHAGERSWGYA